MDSKKTKKWVRLALKSGLLLTDAAIWSAVSRFLDEGSDESENDNARLYRRESFENAESHHGWSHASALLGGIGLGFGLGILLAPVSGERARHAIRHRAIEVKNKVEDAAAWAGRLRSSRPGPASGTYAI